MTCRNPMGAKKLQKGSPTNLIHNQQS
jgi:hypothetical protein